MSRYDFSNNQILIVNILPIKYYFIWTNLFKIFHVDIANTWKWESVSLNIQLILITWNWLV